MPDLLAVGQAARLPGLRRPGVRGPQVRHHDRRQGGERDTDQRAGGLVVHGQGPNGVERHKRGQQQEAGADDTKCGVLDLLASARRGSRRSAVSRQVSTAAKMDSIALAAPNPNSACGLIP